jgi:maltose O-acetyltransferase
MHKFLLLYSWLVRTALIILPDIPFIMRFRGFLYSFGMPEVGRDFQVSANTRLVGLENIQCGNNVFLAANVVINACSNIIFEDEVMVGIASILVSGDHTIKDGSYRYGVSNRAPIIIGRGSWIAGNALVTSGAVLPAASLLAGGAVLSKSFTKSGIYGGVPAKLIEKGGQ